MNASDPGPVSRQIIAEAVLGNRGLIKINGLWLPLTVFLGVPSASPEGTPRSFFLIASAVCAWILTGILANDLADRRHDERAGRKRWINRLPGWAGPLLVILLAGLGPALAVAAGAPAGAGAMLAAATAVGLAYSLRPVRMKERGAWGLATYSLSCALGYVLVPGAWLGSPLLPLGVMASAVFLDKWTNLHFHQVVDFEDDLRSGTSTYAVRAGIERARRTLTRAAWAASLLSLAVLLYASYILDGAWRIAAPAIVAAGALAAAAYAGRDQARFRDGPRLVRELPGSYLALTYGVFRILPLLLLARLALNHAAFWAALGTAALWVAVESRSLLRSRGHLGSKREVPSVRAD